MSNHKRYTRSFLFTALLYGIAMMALFFGFQELTMPKTISKEKTLSLKHVSLIEQVKKQKAHKEQTLVRQETKMPKPKPLAKKIKPKPTPHKELKEQKKEPPKKEEVKKEDNKEQEVIKKSAKSYEQQFVDEHLKKIVQLIQANIKYPKRARVLKIQGKVMVQFTILQNGSIQEIKALSGHRLLIKSSLKAIENASKAFPKVQKSISIKVPIVYGLN